MQTAGHCHTDCTGSGTGESLEFADYQSSCRFSENLSRRNRADSDDRGHPTSSSGLSMYMNYIHHEQKEGRKKEGGREGDRNIKTLGAEEDDAT